LITTRVFPARSLANTLNALKPTLEVSIYQPFARSRYILQSPRADQAVFNFFFFFFYFIFKFFFNFFFFFFFL